MSLVSGLSTQGYSAQATPGNPEDASVSNDPTLAEANAVALPASSRMASPKISSVFIPSLSSIEVTSDSAIEVLADVNAPLPDGLLSAAAAPIQLEENSVIFTAPLSPLETVVPPLLPVFPTAEKPAVKRLSSAAIAQSPNPATEDVETQAESLQSVEPIKNYQPLLEFQAVTLFQDGDFSGRLRATGIYAINDQVMFGATVDLTTGDALVDSEQEGLSLNELYVAAAPIRDLPNLRVVGGLLDLTSYFDRNSFAKDGATHFFNPVFQTNPALSATGIASRPALLLNWSATDQIELKAAAFSSTRDLGDFAVDGFAAELGYRAENLIIRGTFSTARDAGDDSAFPEIFQFERLDGSFGPLDDDREFAYGVNAEYFINAIDLGLFARYGLHQNQDLDTSASTFSFGLNALDVFMERDRLGLAYGRNLSNSDLRIGATPDVLELFYDAPVIEGIRAGVSLQSTDEFSDTFVGFRLRANW